MQHFEDDIFRRTFVDDIFIECELQRKINS